MTKIDLDKLSLDELKTLQKDVDKAVESYEDRRRKEARAAVEARAAEMGFSLSELTDGTAKKKRAPRPAKYRHPENPALTWSGRGRQPGWIKEVIEGGTPIDNFLIKG